MISSTRKTGRFVKTLKMYDFDYNELNCILFRQIKTKAKHIWYYQTKINKIYTKVY